MASNAAISRGSIAPWPTPAEAFGCAERADRVPSASNNCEIVASPDPPIAAFREATMPTSGKSEADAAEKAVLPKGELTESPAQRTCCQAGADQRQHFGGRKAGLNAAEQGHVLCVNRGELNAA